jgi:hypothetical protein
MRGVTLEKKSNVKTTDDPTFVVPAESENLNILIVYRAPSLFQNHQTTERAESLPIENRMKLLTHLRGGKEQFQRDSASKAADSEPGKMLMKTGPYRKSSCAYLYPGESGLILMQEDLCRRSDQQRFGQQS